MTTTPKANAIRRARHQLRVIQARRRARMADLAAADHVNCRALGFGVCDSIHRTTTSTGRGMPIKSGAIGLFAWLAGYGFAAAMLVAAVALAK